MSTNRRACGLRRRRINMITGLIALCGFIQLAAPYHHSYYTPPRLTCVSKKEIAYEVGEMVELPCKAVADPEPTYEWEKDDELLDITSPDFQWEPGTGTIIIPEPLTRHEGIYQCFAKNMYGRAVGLKTMLKKAILEPFPSMTKLNIHHPTIGEPLVLRCNPPFNYPKGIIYWAELFPGGKISGIDYSARVSQDFEGNLYFANVEAKDVTHGDGYVCIVNNEILRSLAKGGDEEVYPVSTPDAPPRILPSLMWSSRPMTVAINGDNLHLKCIFAGYPTPIVKWRRLDAPMPPNVNHTSFGQEIVITKIDDNDMGEYECSATQPGLTEPVRKHFIVHVESMPFWITSPEEVNLSVEEDAEFHCKAGGVPNPNIKWYINGLPIEELPADRHRVVTKYSVRYHNLTKTDAQVLQCNATNKYGYIFANAFLNVLAEPPSFIQAPKSVMKAAQKQDISLKCRTFGAPKPVITWTKDMQPIEDVHRINVKKNGDLKIKGVEASDVGTYKCHARNKLGEIEAHGQLIIREPTQIMPGMPNYQEVNATATVVFSCQATTDPAEQSKLRIDWKRNGQVIDYELEWRISKNMADNCLTITQSMVGDTGAYTCTASNGIDSDEFTIHLTVKDRPYPPTSVTMTGCSATWAEISWEAGSDNNDAVQEFLVYYNTSFDEPGQYHEVDNARIISATERNISLSRWANYTLHVRARNTIGMSARSHLTTTTCRTPPAVPESNPEGVCAESRNPNDLVIVWEPMPEIDHNGAGFVYEVSCQPFNRETDVVTKKISDWRQRELVVENVGTYKKFIVSVFTSNNLGRSHGAQTEVVVHSGEDTPLDQPGNFWLDESTLNATSAMFMWDPVDTDPSRVRGFFCGYQIKFWQSDDPENIRSHDVILENYDPCPLPGDQHRNKRNVSHESTYVMNLWPFSRITAGVIVLNGAKKGTLGKTIEFTTPGGWTVRCYQCEGTSSGNECMDPFDEADIATCTGDICLKTVVTTGQIVSMTRSCVPSRRTIDYLRTSVEASSKETYMCKSDLCNGAPLQHVTGTYAIMLVVFATLIAICQ